MNAAPAPAAISTTTDEQVRHFVDQGFLVREGLVGPAQLEELKRDLLFMARGGYPCKSLKPLPAEMSDDEATKNILCVHQPHYLSPVMRRFAEDPAICGVLSRITAAHLAHWDGSVKCMQTMLFVKPPGKPGQAWHQDELYIPTRDRSLIGAWIAIDDATIENGCLWVIPGSHRPGYLYQQKTPDDLVEYDGASQSFGFDESTAIPVEVKAGSVVFFNGYLLHKSLRNRSQVYRRALVSHYMNSWSLLPWFSTDAGDGPQGIGTADQRTIIQVAGTDPYAWKGVKPGGDDVYLRNFTPPKTDTPPGDPAFAALNAKS